MLHCNQMFSAVQQSFSDAKFTLHSWNVACSSCSELHPLNVETDVLVWKCLVWNILFILLCVACFYIFARYYKLTKQYCLTSDLSCKWLESSTAIVAAVARLTIAPRLPSSSTKVFLRSVLSYLYSLQEYFWQLPRAAWGLSTAQGVLIPQQLALASQSMAQHGLKCKYWIQWAAERIHFGLCRSQGALCAVMCFA